MKKALLPLLSFIALITLLVSCDKKKDPQPAVEKGCLLSSFIYAALPNYPTNFFYNNDGKLIRLEASNQVFDLTEDVIITFEYNTNKQVTKATYSPKSNPTTIDWYMEFVYNTEGLLSTRKIFFTGTNQSLEAGNYYTYEYNSNKQVVKYNDFSSDGTLNRYTIFTYDLQGNVQKEEYYAKSYGGSPSDYQVERIETYEYDDKPNAISTIATYLSDDGDRAFTLSKNNAVKHTIQYPSSTEMYTYQYQYNEKGWATRIDYGNGEVYNLTYTCN